jgi:hypothetical protein
LPFQPEAISSRNTAERRQMATERAVLRHAIAAAAAALCLAAAPSSAIDTVGVHIEKMARGSSRARDIQVTIAFPGAKSSSATVRVARIDLGPELGSFDDVRIDCAHPVIREPMFSCGDANLKFRSGLIGAQNIRAALSWNTESQSLQFAGRGLRIAGGSLRARATWTKRRWTLAVDADLLSLADLRKLLGKASPLPESWTLDGKLGSLHAQLSGAAFLQRIDADATIADANLSNPDGTTAAEGFGSHFSVHAQKRAKAWQFDAAVQAARGEILAGRWYWNFGMQPMTADSRGQWRSDGTLAVDNAAVKLGDMLAAGFAGEIKPKGVVLIPSMRMSLTDFNFAALPPQTRDGALAGTVVSQLQGSGHFSGSFEIQDDTPVAVDIRLRNVTLEDRSAKLAVAGLDGHLVWNSLTRSKQLLAAIPPADIESRLNWRGGLLYGVGIGGAAVQFVAAAGDIRFTAPVRVPILDGGLAIQTLQLRRVGEAGMSIRFDSTLEPISVPLLCKAFGWPEFAGTLSGRIPDLNLEAGVLTLGGALQAAVFDGEVSVRDLRLSDPFGARPRLQANMSFERLDLAAVTGAFSFGKITGRISGHANDLELVGWEPVAFDASLYTTPGDRSRKRISQRAVQNISSIGGGTGAAAALQRGFLRFFNEFSYSKLGLSCKLANDVCLMQGVEPRAQGYYLVKGSGLPRIDVIGEAHRIDWLSLVASLKQLPESQPSVGKPP